MKAYTKIRYGGPEVLRLKEVAKPSIKDDHILVKVKANSANPADWHTLRGWPFFARFSSGLFKSRVEILRTDFTGIAEEVGDNATPFELGDRVFGENLDSGAYDDYTFVQAKSCASMPESLGFTTIGHMMEVRGRGAFSKYALSQFTAEAHTKNLATLASTIEEGLLKYFLKRHISIQTFQKSLAILKLCIPEAK